VAGSYRRRRHILAGLAVLAAGSVAPAVLLGGSWWIAPAVVGGLLLTYLALLVRRQRRITDRLRKVRYLAPIRAPRPAVVVLGTGAAR
jgi:Flp pilus assembly protein TadB